MMTKIDLVIEKAAVSKSNSDYEDFFNIINDKELYFNISKNNNKNSKNINVPTVSVNENMEAIVVYTSPKDNRLNERYAGIEWKKCLEMVKKMGNVDGMIIQSSTNAWIAIDKQKIKELLLEYKQK